VREADFDLGRTKPGRKAVIPKGDHKTRMFLNNMYTEDPHFSSKSWRPMNRFGTAAIPKSCGDTFENSPNYGYIYNISGQGI